jgi:hypothetical protein
MRVKSGAVLRARDQYTIALNVFLYVSILTCSALLTELSLICMLLTCSIFYGLWPVFELPGMRIKWNGMECVFHMKCRVSIKQWHIRLGNGIYTFFVCVHPNVISLQI